MNQKTFLEKLYDFLLAHYPELKDRYFSTSKNHFGPHPQWLFDTPHGYWGENPDDPFRGPHSERMTELVTKMIVDARKEVDITNLRLPSGEFLDALVKGVVENKSTETLKIRILCGRGGQEYLDAEAFVRDFQKRINNKLVELYVGVQTVTLAFEVPIGWNHAKYIAVDGKTILFGGHNYIEKTYLGKNPIFDISMKLVGRVTAKAHIFSNELWKFVNKYYSGGHTTYSESLKDNIIQRREAPMFSEIHDTSVSEGNVPVVHVTQPGHGLIENNANPYANPSLSSIYYALGNAKKSICISQQDIGGMGGRESNGGYEGVWRETSAKVPFVAIRDPQDLVNVEIRYFDINLLHSLTSNLISNDKLIVEMVLSNIGSEAEAGGEHGSYSNNVSASCVYRALGWYMIKRLGVPDKKAMAIVQKQVFIRTIGFAKETKWRAHSKKIIGNHAKFWSVDDEVCSIGSNNFYPSTIHRHGVRTGHHQEWAVIIGNNQEDVVKHLKADYFDNVYKSSCEQPFKESYLWALRDPQYFPTP
jgi:PLD-like domain